MGNLTENFSIEEFQCQGSQCCGHSAPINFQLVEALQQLRDMTGPLTILSGFRCQTHNKKIGSQPTSQHCLGNAADVMLPPGYSIIEFAAKAQTISAFRHGGIGLYEKNCFVHLDIRNTGLARWGFEESKA